MSTSEEGSSVPDVAPPSSSKVADAAPVEDTSTKDAAGGPPGASQTGEQLLTEDIEPKREKDVDLVFIPINQVLTKIRERSAKLAKIAPTRDLTTKTLHTVLAEDRQTASNIV